MATVLKASMKTKIRKEKEKTPTTHKVILGLATNDIKKKTPRIAPTSVRNAQET